MEDQKFHLKAPFSMMGDQPEAVRKLVDGLNAGKRYQTLLGVTGSGKTFTIANVIQQVQRPTLVISHNKTARWSILFLTTITTSRRPTCLRRIPISKRTRM